MQLLKYLIWRILYLLSDSCAHNQEECSVLGAVQHRGRCSPSRFCEALSQAGSDVNYLEVY